MRIPKSKIIKMLEATGCVPFGDCLGKDTWESPDGVIIRLTNGNTIHIDELELIALDQLNLSNWEYDYLIGQIGIA